MRYLTVALCISLAVFFGNVVESFALPPCPSDHTQRFHNCVGTHIFANGDKYVGSYKDGHWNQGTYTNTNGDRYFGEFKNNKKHGRGILIYADGKVEQGIWKGGRFQSNMKTAQTVTAKKIPQPSNDVLNSSKEFFLPQCKGSPRLISDYKEVASWDECNGEVAFGSGGGTRVGNKYSGEWKDGRLHGQGIYVWASGTKYVGEFKDGKTHGQGIKTSVKGDKYVGEFKNNRIHGQGTFVRADGTKHVGEFKNGKIISPSAYTSASPRTGLVLQYKTGEGPETNLSSSSSGKCSYAQSRRQLQALRERQRGESQSLNNRHSAERKKNRLSDLLSRAGGQGAFANIGRAASDDRARTRQNEVFQLRQRHDRELSNLQKSIAESQKNCR